MGGRGCRLLWGTSGPGSGRGRLRRRRNSTHERPTSPRDRSERHPDRRGGAGRTQVPHPDAGSLHAGRTWLVVRNDTASSLGPFAGFLPATVEREVTPWPALFSVWARPSMIPERPVRRIMTGQPCRTNPPCAVKTPWSGPMENQDASANQTPIPGPALIGDDEPPGMEGFMQGRLRVEGIGLHASENDHDRHGITTYRARPWSRWK